MKRTDEEIVFEFLFVSEKFYDNEHNLELYTK